MGPTNLDQISISEIRMLTAAVYETYGTDLRDYALSSLNRRVLRAIDLFKCRSVENLVEQIKADEEFFQKFLEELTVNTTEMFRDPEMWTHLRDMVFPQLENRKTIRVWHAACSTGEEVYSMGILLRELGLSGKTKLFATDINPEVLKIAKAGVYPLIKMELNKENYGKFGGLAPGGLEDYYTADEEERTATMDQELIAQAYFNRHDLVIGEPFGKFDLVLARNILIYFNKTLQNSVLKLIHENMTLGGFLILGSKETIRWNEYANKFLEVNREEKIYKKIKD